eukprot:9084051-Pyramimonas_sp.AAC.1
MHLSQGVWITDQEPRYGAQWLKTLLRSTSPGIRPRRWFNMSHVERRKVVEQFRLEKRGLFGVEDLGPCMALLSDIGIDAVDFQDDKHGNAGTEHPEGNVHSGAEVRRRKKGDTI